MLASFLPLLVTVTITVTAESNISETLAHGEHTPVLTDQKCHIEQVELIAEVCTPTITKDCKQVKVKALAIESREQCVKVVKTVCNEVDEVVDNTVCYTVYETETQEVETTSVKVEYEVKCEDEARQVCPQQQYGGYGHKGQQGYCKHSNTKVCYNTPKASPSPQTVSVDLPVPKEKCEEREVKIPRVECEDVTEERCFNLPFTTQETESFEQCTTELGPPKCQETTVKLPKQVCVGPFFHPEPSYHTPTPTSYHSPSPPIYHAPAPPAYLSPTPSSYHAPTPATYHAPTPATYHAPDPPIFHENQPLYYSG